VSSALNQQAIQLARSGRTDEAIALWQQLLSFDPANLAVKANLARCLFTLSRYQDVLQLLGSDSHWMKHPPLCGLAAQSALKLRQHLRAVDILQQSLLHTPGHPQLALELSSIYLQLERNYEAIELLKTLADQFPNEVAPRLNLAIAFEQEGNLAFACEIYRDLISNGLGDHSFLVNALKFNQRHKLFNQSDDLLNIYQLNYGKTPLYHSLFIDHLLSCGKLGDAISYFRSHSAANPIDIKTRDSLIFSLIDQKLFSDASSLVDDAWSSAAQSELSTRMLTAMIDLPNHAKPKCYVPETFDPRRLVQTFQLLQPDDPQLVSLEAYLRHHPTLLKDRPGKPTRGGYQSHDLFDETVPEIALLTILLRGRLSEYSRQLSWHPLFRHVSHDGEHQLTGWGVVLQSGGRQIRHTHPNARISGVLYLRCPDFSLKCNENEGALWFSPSPFEETLDDQPMSDGLFVRPSAGVLVLFPSFLPHETIPFYSNDERLCLAFDEC